MDDPNASTRWLWRGYSANKYYPLVNSKALNLCLIFIKDGKYVQIWRQFFHSPVAQGLTRLEGDFLFDFLDCTLCEDLGPKFLIAKPAIDYFQAPFCFSNTSHCHHWNRLQQVMVVLFKSSSSSSDCPSLQLFSCLWWKTATRLSRYLQTSGFKLVAHRYNLTRYAHTLTWRSFTVFHDESLDKEQVWRLWWLWGTKTMMVMKS